MSHLNLKKEIDTNDQINNFLTEFQKDVNSKNNLKNNSNKKIILNKEIKSKKVKWSIGTIIGIIFFAIC